MHRRRHIPHDGAAGGGKDESADPVVHRGLEQVKGPRDIYPHIRERIKAGLHHPRVGGQMDDNIHARHRFGHHPRVQNIPPDQLEGEAVQILGPPGAEIIQDADDPPPGDQEPHQVGPNKTGAAGYQNPGHCLIRANLQPQDFC